MKNKILTLFRNNIPYIKELRMLSGSVTASILMQQLDYWFEKSPNGFISSWNRVRIVNIIKKATAGLKNLDLVKQNSRQRLKK